MCKELKHTGQGPPTSVLIKTVNWNHVQDLQCRSDSSLRSVFSPVYFINNESSTYMGLSVINNDISSQALIEMYSNQSPVNMTTRKFLNVVFTACMHVSHTPFPSDGDVKYFLAGNKQTTPSIAATFPTSNTTSLCHR